MWLIWLILSGVFLICEIFTVSFLLFWFGIGAFFALLTSLVTDSILIQVLVFTISTTLMVIFMKPLVKKFFKENEEVKSNTESLIGKNGIVIKEINNIESKGQIKVNGELWSAFSENPTEIIEAGSTVCIEDIRGVKLKVKKI